MHEELLYWAVGRDVSPPPTIELPDWESALRRIKDHRLVSRLDQRVRTYAPDWVTPGIRASLNDEVGDYVRIRDSYCEQVSQLDATLAKAGLGPVVVLKGLTAWAHTRDSGQLVATGDLDVVTTRPGDLEATLHNAGFYSAFDRMPHEFANLESDDERWPIDLHEYFPLWGYRTAKSPLPFEGSIQQNSISITSSRLSPDYLLADAVNAFDTSNGLVLVPDVTDCVLIRCAHVVHDYLEPPYFLAGSKFRLSEIAEIRELSMMPEFDAGRLEQVLRANGGDDCIGLINQIFTWVYGSPLLTDLRPDDGIFLPPLELCWGINVETPRKVDQLLDENATLAELVSVVPATHISLVKNDPQIWTTRADTDLKKFEKTLVSWSSARETDFDMVVELRDTSLRLQLEIAGPPGNFLDEVRIVFPTDYLSTAHEVSRGSFRLPPVEEWGPVDWIPNEGASSVAISIPMDTIRKHYSAPGEPIIFVIAIDRFKSTVGHDWEDFFEHTLASCAVPLIVNFAPRST